MPPVRHAARLAISLVVFVLCAELVALLWYFVQTRSLFYTRAASAIELPLTPADRLAPGDTVHPYFGFAHAARAAFHDERTTLLTREGWRSPSAVDSNLPTNNFGFISPHAYPLQKTGTNQFFVGIFGGSVGMWFCQVGAPRLVERLEQHAFFRGKEIVPLCFAYSGYKQPQHALILGYFLSIGQPLDLVVNIDGFNDVALAALNHERGLDISMPSVQHLEGLINLVNQSTLTPDKLESLAAVFRDRASLIELSGTIGRNRSAAIDVVLTQYYGWILARYVSELARYADLPSNAPEHALVQLNPPVATRDRARAFADMADLWTRGSILMRDMLVPRGAAYVHVLQPNQYFTTRRFGAAEAATALSDKSPYKRSVEEGYPVLQAAARATLAANNVSFFDATRVLDDEPSPVYLDDCCHYTVIGNQVLADFIAASILRTSGPWND